jgi:hypothetical protein
MARNDAGHVMFFLGLVAVFAGAVVTVGAAAWNALWGGAGLVVIIGLVVMLVHAVVAGLGAYLRR